MGNDLEKVSAALPDHCPDNHFGAGFPKPETRCFNIVNVVKMDEIKRFQPLKYSVIFLSDTGQLPKSQ
jgi:hypothetical protein